MSKTKGRVTLPSESNFLEETKEMLDRWGAVLCVTVTEPNWTTTSSLRRQDIYDLFRCKGTQRICQAAHG